MKGIWRPVSAQRVLMRAALILLVILVGGFPAPSGHAERIASVHAQSMAMSDHAVPADKKAQDLKAHPACDPGLGCFAFIVLVEEALAITPFSAIIMNVDIARLATRTVAPPLPPPKPATLG